MKKFVIFTATVAGVGGAQIYVRNKRIYMESNGWKVWIFSYSKNKVLIPEFKHDKGIILEELRSPVYSYSKEKIKCVKELIIEQICPSEEDEIIIESHVFNAASWGELVAEEINAKHIVLLLSESFSKLSKYKYDFFSFKHARRELAGIAKESLPNLFRGEKQLQEEEKFFLRASCTNCVEDIPCEIIVEKEQCDIIIGCLSRLNKIWCIDAVLSLVMELANRNKDKTIQLLFIGGAPNDKYLLRIQNKLKKTPNIMLKITGYIYPVPREIVQKVDVFICTSGSAIATAREDVPTIKLSFFNRKPEVYLTINQHNKTLEEKSFNSEYTVDKVLDDCIKAPHLSNRVFNRIDNVEGFEQLFNAHLQFYGRTSNEKDYFDIITHKKDAITYSRILYYKLFIQ